MKMIDYEEVLKVAENIEYWCREIKKDVEPFSVVMRDVHGLERAIETLKIALKGEEI